METPLSEHPESPGFTCSEESHGVQCSDRGLHIGAAETGRADCKSRWRRVSDIVYLRCLKHLN